MKSKLCTGFVLVCAFVFICLAINCVIEFINQKPLTQRSLENQELYNLPSICIESMEKEGDLKSILSDFDDEQKYNNISWPFEELVGDIQIKREINDGSDAYEIITIRNHEFGLTLERCEYQKCFCIHFSARLASYGIQTIDIHMKANAKISTVAPRNYLSAKRKHTRFFFETCFSYSYDLLYSISKVLSLPPTPCSSELDWNQDSCKLKYINDKIVKSLNCTTPWLLSFAR